MLTIQQATAVHALLNTTSHIALIARAGCGKTFTILEMIRAYVAEYPEHELVVAAYNTAIKDEIKSKLEGAGFGWRQVQAATAHSLGNGLLQFRFNSVINDKKVRDIVRAQVYKSPVCAAHGSLIEKLVRMAKQAAVGYFSDLPADDLGVWTQLGEHYRFLEDFEDEGQEVLEKVLRVAQWVYRQSLADTTQVDFDDMILFPLMYHLRVKFAKDVVFVDEAQDLSRARQALLRKFVKPGIGRMVIVGDDRQAIYGFSGADSEALPRMISELSATVLPLTVTWRCPKAVVALAQATVPDFTAADDAPEGAVLTYTTEEEFLASLHNETFILCRNTSPLIEMAYTLLRKKIGCKVEGRDIGEGLKNLVGRWKVTTTAALLTRLDTYEAREVAKAMAKDDEAKAEAVVDRVGSLRFIVTEVNLAGKTGVADVLAFIDSLFADCAKGVLTLATYHRSKGRERRHVVLYQHAARCPSKWAKRDHEKRQEENLAYVAQTRAMETLAFYG